MGLLYIGLAVVAVVLNKEALLLVMGVLAAVAAVLEVRQEILEVQAVVRH
jgi:hypothetical protein